MVAVSSGSGPRSRSPAAERLEPQAASSPANRTASAIVSSAASAPAPPVSSGKGRRRGGAVAAAALPGAPSPLKAAGLDSCAGSRRGPGLLVPLSQLASRLRVRRGPVRSACAPDRGTRSMRPLSMSGHFLLSPIPESSSDYLLPKDIKLAVLGAGRVGKSGECGGDPGAASLPGSGRDHWGRCGRRKGAAAEAEGRGAAMIVRFLTKRFIGDYEPNTGKLYSRLVYVEGDQLSLQIQDTPGGVQIQDSLPQVVDSLSKCVQWAEGFLLVYSITDYDSYLSIRPLYQHIRKVHPDSKAPVIIVGNKGDLLHARQVQTQDGIQLANELGSLFLEISTSENYEDVCDVFQHLCKEVSKMHGLSGERRRASIIPRPRSPNMQDLKRRFKQALSPKVKAPTALG
ncbi:ras-like protein family member 11A isoform X1 [Macaca mulatta]